MFEFIKDVFAYALIVVIIILIRVYVLSTAEVIGPSMEPNLKDGNIMLMEKLSPQIKKYNRFDVVVIKYTSPSYLIKRIIGMPGDKIKCINNTLYINDEKISEKYKTKGTMNNFELAGEVPKDSYFVLGDNREESVDSRRIGYIKQKDIFGKALIIVWPFNKIKFVK